jgi:hypothetical protein
MHFHPAALSDADFQAVQRSVRSRCLRPAVRHGALTQDTAEDLTPLAPRARAPPEFHDNERVLTLDQSPSWDQTVPAPERVFEFNQEQDA